MGSCLFAFGTQAPAANVIWNGTVDDNWATAGNWSPASMPAAADTAIFPATAAPRTVSFGAGVTVTSLTVTPSPYTFGAGGPGAQTLTLPTGGFVGLVDSGSGAALSATIDATLVLGTTAGASAHQFYAARQDAVLTLAGPIRGGTGGAAGTKVLTLDSSKPSREATIVVDGVVGGGGGTLAVTKTGTGRLVLNGSNTFTGPLTLRGGTTAISQFNNANADGPLGHSAGAVIFDQLGANAVLEYTGPTAATTKPLSGVSSPCVVSVVEPTTELTLNGVVSGTGATLAKRGPGTLIVAAANTHTGGTSVAEGLLRLTGAGTLGTSAAALSLFGGSCELNSHSVTVSGLSSNLTDILSNDGPTDCTLTVNTTAALALVNGRLMDTKQATSGKLSFVKSGTGAISLGGDNAYSGTTSINAGVVVCTHGHGLGSTAAGTTVASGATLEMKGDSAEPVTFSGAGAAGEGGALLGFNESSLTGPVALAAATTFATFPYGPLPREPFLIESASPITGNFALTLAGTSEGEIRSAIATGTGTLTKNGAGMWTLAGPNTYTGLTTVADGTLSIRHPSALGGTGNGTSITAGATLQIAGDITTAAEPLTVRGTGDTAATGAVENVSGDNTYAGLLTLGADATLASDSGVLIFSHTGNITGAGFDLTLTGAGDGRIDSAVATGAGLVIKNGPGTWKLAALNTYTARTTVNEGLLEITTLKNVSGGSSSLGAPTTAANGTISLGAAGTTGGLRFTGSADATSNRVINLAGTTGNAVLESSSPTNAKLALTSALTATGAGDKKLVLTGTSTAANEIAGAIVNSAGFKTSVEKNGPGSWTLSGTNTYTGNTRIAAGTLTLTKAGLADASDVELTSGALLNLTFAGSDTVARLFVDGIQQSAGTWGSPASTAAHKSSLFAGTGVLNVGSGPALEPYASWIAGFGVTGLPAAFSSDADGDGVSNGLEWVLGGNPTSAASAPAPVLNPAPGGGWTLNFSRSDASEATSTLVLSRSADLVVWTDFVVGPATFVDSASGIAVAISENAGAADAIVVTLPAGPSPLFLRLEVVSP